MIVAKLKIRLKKFLLASFQENKSFNLTVPLHLETTIFFDKNAPVLEIVTYISIKLEVGIINYWNRQARQNDSF